MDPAVGDRSLILESKELVLFDGDCAYCNSWVNWIRGRDPQRRFRFVALNSAEGRSMRSELAIPSSIDSVVLVQGGKAHYKSAAAWRILRALPGYGLAGALLASVPSFLRDAGYDLIARNRHRLGLKDECELPPK
jgi:predicted DCC family thiol-disulfide oxidoreductase YuxK